jgi:hypothetical protein
VEGLQVPVSGLVKKRSGEPAILNMHGIFERERARRFANRLRSGRQSPALAYPGWNANAPVGIADPGRAEEDLGVPIERSVARMFHTHKPAPLKYGHMNRWQCGSGVSPDIERVRSITAWQWIVSST